MTEPPRGPPATPVVERLAALFAGYASAHGTHGEPVQRDTDGKWTIKTTARTIMNEPVSIDLWQQHVAGTRPLGVGPTMEDDNSVWGSIDYDVYDDDILPVLKRVEESQMPLLPCRSKSGGLHLFLFLSFPAPAKDVQAVLYEMSARLGLGGSEIFPKQTQVLRDRGDGPSWMVMPYFGSTYGGKIFEQVGLRFNGAELTLEEFVRAGERLRTTLLELGEYRASSRKPSRAARAEPPGKAPREAFSDGPPCLQILSREKTGSGGNNLLIMMGCYYKKAFPNEWEQKIEEANVLYCLPPRGSDEIQSMIRSLRKKEYNYTCQTEPMRSSCNSKACRNRRYGVGAWGGYPDISGLTVLKTEPVVWFVDVDGERIEIGSDDLQMYSKFHKVCLEKLNRCYKTMKQDTWLKMVNAAMEHVCVVDPPEDGAPGARIMELIEEWLTNRRKGTRREDLLTGRPWQNDAVDGRYEFRLKDLQKFVDASGEREMTRPRLIRILQRNGGDTGFYAVSGKGVNFWWLPRWAVEGDPEVSVRKLPEEEN